MGTAVQLSPSLVVRLRLQVEDLGGFHWEDRKSAEPLLTDLCGPLVRERALLLMAIEARVPKAINRALARSQGESIEACLRFVAKHFALREAIDREEAQWAVETMAGSVGLIEISPDAIEMAIAEAETANQPSPIPRPGQQQGRPVPPRNSSYQTNNPWFTDASRHDAAPAVRIMPFSAEGKNAPSPAPIGPWLKSSTSSATSINAPDYGLDAHPLGYGKESSIPPEVDDGKWCWSGFLGGVWWMWAHKMRWGLPVVVLISVASSILGQGWIGSIFNLGLVIYLGFKGNQLAWSHRTFTSVSDFRAVQKAWVIFGVFWFIACLVSLALGVAMLLVMLHFIQSPVPLPQAPHIIRP